MQAGSELSGGLGVGSLIGELSFEMKMPEERHGENIEG
jgi:hypothetical protein